MRAIDADDVLKTLGYFEKHMIKTGCGGEDGLKLIRSIMDVINNKPTCFDFYRFKSYLKELCETNEAKAQKAEKAAPEVISLSSHHFLAAGEDYRILTELNFCFSIEYQDKNNEYAEYLKRRMEALSKGDING
jgi:hypothetical protein